MIKDLPILLWKYWIPWLTTKSIHSLTIVGAIVATSYNLVGDIEHSWILVMTCDCFVGRQHSCEARL
mgnify:FL=1